jgi:outer membrane receptor for ferrienterochelin and colicins
MKDHDKFSVYGAFQSVDRDSYYGAGQDPLAYGHTEDFSYSLGTQLHKDLEKCLFTHSDLVVGLEVSSDALKDTKLGGYDEEAAEHIENTLIADQKVTTYGAFAQNEWIWEAVRLGVGLRAEHYNITDKASNANDISGDVLAPRANLLVNVTSQLQLRTSFARGYRAPQIFDEDLHIESSTARRVTHENDPDLEQETSNSYTFSVDYTEQLGKFVCQFLAEAFYTDLQNPFVNEYGEPDADGNVVYTRYNAEDGAVVKGVNMELNASVGSRFVFQSGLTLQSSKYDVAQSFDERRFFRTPDTYGYLTMTYSPTARFKLSATGNYTGKMLIEYFGPEQENPDAGELRETGTFFDLGLKVSQDFKLADDLNLRVYGGVKNVFNSYQDDFDTGAERDPAYIYGPLSPRTFYIGVKLGNLF